MIKRILNNFGVKVILGIIAYAMALYVVKIIGFNLGYRIYGMLFY